MTMTPSFRRILVPVDFGLASDEVIDAGQAIRAGEQYIEIAAGTQASLEMATAIAAGGKIRLVHATPELEPVNVYAGPEGVWFPTETARELHDRAHDSSMAVLKELAGRHCADADVDFAVAPGPPTDMILEAARAFEADLIIVGASGRGRASRLFLGSTADKVIRQAGCPVLVIPNTAEDAT